MNKNWKPVGQALWVIAMITGGLLHPDYFLDLVFRGQQARYMVLLAEEKSIDSEDTAKNAAPSSPQAPAVNKELPARSEPMNSSGAALPKKPESKVFIPTEKIPADQAVDFPADI
jgi:hypothetical protein